MKTRKLIILSTVLGTLFMAGCLKKGSMNIDPNPSTGSFLTLQYLEGGSGSTINSGMQYFSGGALTYPPSDDVDTATFDVSIGGSKVLSKDVNVTVGVDETKVLDNFSSDSITYELMPDSLYDFVSTTATIKAGDRSAPVKIVFYPSKVDPSKSYMLPVVVKDAGGQSVSSNFGVIYFHIIGNPIAGPYTFEWIRWNNAAGSGNPTYDEVYDDLFSPVNPTTVSFASGSGPVYMLTFKNSGGVLSDFKVKFDAASVTAAGITITSGPSITVADPTTNTYEFVYTYNNSAGSGRKIIDKMHK